MILDDIPSQAVLDNIADEIVLYNTEAELYSALKEINPDVRIVGADWKGKPFTGYDLPSRVVFNSRDHGYSTSELRMRVMSAEMQKIVKKNLAQHMPENAADIVNSFLKNS